MTPGAPVSPLRRPLAVSLYFAAHAVAALILALPVTTLVAGTGIGRFRDGDRALFEPGGVVLAEVARLLLPSAPAHAAASLVTGTLLAVLLLVPHAALLVSLDSPAREPQGTLWGRAIARLPALVSLSGLAFLAQAVVLFATTTLAGAVRASFRGPTTRGADLTYVAVVALGALVVLLLGVVRDLGRAAIVRDGIRSKAAVRAGLIAFASVPGRCLLGWAAPAVLGVALVLLGAALVNAIDVSRSGNWRLWVVAIVHQAIAYALAWCRAFWMSAALGVVAEATGGTRLLRKQVVVEPPTPA